MFELYFQFDYLYKARVNMCAWNFTHLPNKNMPVLYKPESSTNRTFKSVRKESGLGRFYCISFGQSEGCISASPLQVFAWFPRLIVQHFTEIGIWTF